MMRPRPNLLRGLAALLAAASCLRPAGADDTETDPLLRHWSVQAVRRDFPPDASLDAFVRARLDARGLAMAPEADRRTLIRRLSFDLLGLPPTPERVERFVRDPSPRAYGELVDEFLASPHYGERWARHWLDIAHYADTHGFERDQLRPNAWPYRDYVIASFNADKPYDRFLREQIAGDVVAPEDAAATIATGFLAAGPWDFVGHVETQSEMLKRAARAGDLDDMATQVITSTMGITINCARCHDHKLDPITQEEYFRVLAVFAGVTRGERPVEGAKAGLSRQLARIESQRAELLGEGLDLADMVGGGDGRGTGTKNLGIEVLKGETGTDGLGFIESGETNVLRPPHFADGSTPPPFVRGVFIPQGGKDGGVRLSETIALRDLPESDGKTWDRVRNGKLNQQVHAKIGEVDFEQPPHSILGLHANGGVTFDLGEIRRANGFGALQLTAVLGFGARPEEAESKADFSLYLDAERILHRAGLRKSETVPIAVDIPESAAFLTLVATDGGDSIGSDLLFLGDARLRPGREAGALTEAEQARLGVLQAESARLREALAAVAEPPVVYAFTRQEVPPVVRVQRRGNPEDEGAEVTPGGFGWVGHASADFGDQATPEHERRRRLAAWIVHPDNPLTARVMMNRLWHHHFGQGIVATPSDFGLGGENPSHPELLDWLANGFRQSGWSVKDMQRLIVTSTTYRQASATTNPEAQALDASNRLLWRQNPQRLDAESIRDAVLHVAGTLNLERGGPGFRDFRYTEAYAPIYDYITPDKPELWRRSIYRFIVRTTPHPFLSTLDCPDPANLTPARVRTTTALQALALSNNPFMLQQAQHLAVRIENEAATPTETIRRAFALVFQREPVAAEEQAAARLVADQGLFALCRMLLNANEFVYLD